MSEENKQVARDLWSYTAAGDFEKMATLYDENVQYHGPGGDERSGRDAVIENARGYKTAFPDLTVEIDQILAEDDCVAVRARPQGTNTGELFGMPATGKPIDVKWVMNIVRIANGKVVEEWEIFDNADLMKQLGVA